MNALLAEIRRSLGELDLGLRGVLTMSEGMERLQAALAAGAVPASWAAAAYPSLRPLRQWVDNLVARAAQLAEWTADLQVRTKFAAGERASLSVCTAVVP